MCIFDTKNSDNNYSCDPFSTKLRCTLSYKHQISTKSFEFEYDNKNYDIKINVVNTYVNSFQVS